MHAKRRAGCAAASVAAPQRRPSRHPGPCPRRAGAHRARHVLDLDADHHRRLRCECYLRRRACGRGERGLARRSSGRARRRGGARRPLRRQLKEQAALLGRLRLAQCPRLRARAGPHDPPAARQPAADAAQPLLRAQAPLRGPSLKQPGPRAQRAPP